MVSIILPTYNEADNIANLVGGLISHIKQPLEIIVVDDDSRDFTWKIAESLAKPNVKVIRRIQERGLPTAIAKGLSESKGDIVGWMDADMSMPPSLLPEMLSCIGSYDIVMGSRYVKGGHDARGFFRVITSRVINCFAGLLLGFGIKDYDSGFIVLKRSVLDKVAFPSAIYGEYFIDFIFRCKRGGFRIKELPYTFTERKEGLSKTAPGLFAFLRLGYGYIARIIALRFSAIN